MASYEGKDTCSNQRGRSKSWSKMDFRKVRCRDKVVTLSTDDHLKWEGDKTKRTRKLSLFSCTGSGRDVSPVDTSDIYSSSSLAAKSDYYNDKSGFSLRRIKLPWKSKSTKDDSSSDDSNNNYCIMEPRQSFSRTQAIYGTGKRVAKKSAPPLPPRPTLTSSRITTTTAQPAKQQIKVLELSFLHKPVISGLAVTRKQDYVVVDLHAAYLVDSEGNLKRLIGNKGCQRLQEPIAVCVMDGGNTLVFSDHAHQQVKMYNLRGQFLHKVADPTLCNIAGVAVNQQKQIFIAGTDKQRVSVHSENDQLLYTIPSSTSKSLFEHPYSLAISPLTGAIIIGDDYHQKVTAVNSSGRILWRFTPAQKYMERAFFPVAIAVDNSGYVFVADLLNCNVYMLDSSGRFIKLLLSRCDGLMGPAAMATDGQGQLIVADEDRRLKVFQYGSADSVIPWRNSVREDC